MAVVRGANAPLLEKTILDQLEAEKKVLAEGGERRAVRRVEGVGSRVLEAWRLLVPNHFWSRPCKVPQHTPASPQHTGTCS